MQVSSPILRIITSHACVSEESSEVKLSSLSFAYIPSNIERPAAWINAYPPSSGGSAIECAATAYLAFSKRSSLVSTFVCGRHTLGHWASCGSGDL